MRDNTKGLLVVGGASLDVLHVHGVPHASAGGAGLYTAVAAARAGADVTMLAPRPDPMPGSLAPALDHIRWIGPRVPPEDLPRFEIAYESDGTISRFSEHTGAEPEMTPDLLDAVAELPPWAYCVPFLDAALQHAFIRALEGRGCVTVAATYTRAVRTETETVLATMEAADLFFCNDDEAAVLFGTALSGSAVAARGVTGRLLLVTRGPDGATVHQGSHSTAVPAPPTDVVDPTGAGDTFCGTTVARLLQGEHPVEAARHGVAAASSVVGGLGPDVLLGHHGPARQASGGGVRVDEDRVRSLASLLADLDGVVPFDFVAENLPPVGAPGALDFFFAATIQQFGFWHDEDGRWVAPMVASLGNTTYKGSDFLWAAYLRWAREQPEVIGPAGHRGLGVDDLAAGLHDDNGSCPLPERAIRHRLAVSYGETMVELDWTPASVVEASRRSPRPVGSLLGRLDHVGGYREDPLRKKSALLAMILRQRPEAWLPTVAGDDLPPIVDYHVQRTCLRTGMVEVTDPELGAALRGRRLVDAESEDEVRRAAYRATALLAELSGRSMGAVDRFMFGMRLRCPESSPPDCGACPARPACVQDIALFQPVFRTDAY